MAQALWPGWETVGLIGKGGFGSVYEIRRTMFEETEKAALKVIRIPLSGSEIDELYGDGYTLESISQVYARQLKSIVGEYTMMRKMSDCANIVSCDDIRYVQHSDGIGWDIFIKMELLNPVLKVFPQTFSEQLVVKAGKDLCNALVTCRQHAVLHRDIKPQNIFVTDRGEFKLGDFGVAKTVEQATGGTKIGTYKYMAPEVYNNKPYGAAADIYSLGLVLYWMLNDRRLPFLPMPPAVPSFQEEEQAKLLRFRGEPLPPPKNGSDALKAVVLKACAFDPADRFESADQMLEALEHTDITVWVPRLNRTKTDPSLKKQNYKPIYIGVAVLLLFTLVFGIMIAMLNSNSEPPPPTISEDPPITQPTTPPTTPPTTLPPATTPVATTPPTYGENTGTPAWKVGDTVTFGSYEQDGNTANGKEAIEWYVLSIDGDKALLLSKYALDCQTYHTSYQAATWENCMLRTWLNDTFFHQAFSPVERSNIIKAHIPADKNPKYNTAAGNATDDNVFLLSIEQAENYLRDQRMIACKATEYAIQQNIYIADSSKLCWWWLRTPGQSSASISGVNTDGTISYNGSNKQVDGETLDGYNISRPGAGIRPAIWINTDT